MSREDLNSQSIIVVLVGFALLGLGLAGVALPPDAVTVTADEVLIRDRLTRRTVARSDVIDVDVRQRGARAAVYVVTTGELIELKHTRLWVNLQGDTMAGGRSTALLERLASDLRQELFQSPG